MKTDDEWLANAILDHILKSHGRNLGQYKAEYDCACGDILVVDGNKESSHEVVARHIASKISAHFQAKELEGCKNELQKAGDHWWNCDGDKCEFSAGSKGCGYDEHRQAELLHQLQQLKNGES